MSHLHIYDTGQQEAWLRWLLLKEFDHHMTYPLPKGMEAYVMAVEYLVVWGSLQVIHHNITP